MGALRTQSSLDDLPVNTLALDEVSNTLILEDIFKP
jgi:hypothetical protein